MACCLVGVGSNVGDREGQLERAIDRLAADGAVAVTARSRGHLTRPAGGPPGQPPYLNAAVRCETALDPVALWQRLQQIEQDLGRVRHDRWGPRTIDLDLLLYGDIELNTPQLIVPHPRMAFRRFVLEPAIEVGPDMTHPTTGWTVRELLTRLDELPPYVALLGGPARVRRAAAERAAQRLGCHLVLDDSTPDAPAGLAECGTEAADSADGRGARGPLECLRRRVELLADVGRFPQRDTSRDFVLSDFGCVESLARAQAFLPEAERQVVDEHWRSLPRGIAYPRLTVNCGRAGPAGAQTPENRLEQELERILRTRRQWVVLRLSPPAVHEAGEPGLSARVATTEEFADAIVEEVVGAVVAMQSSAAQNGMPT